MRAATSFILIIIVLAVDTFAQLAMQEEEDIIPQRGLLQITPLFQRWSLDSASISETSAGVFLYQPLTRAASVSLRGSFAATGGDVTGLSGLTDIHLSGNYYWENPGLVFGLTIGVPSGRKKLSLGEFQTSAVLAENVFRFQVPTFGSGFNVTPNIMWALPLSEDVVFGLGAAFQYRGEYTPIENAGTFKPGDEILGTFGLDVRVAEVSSLAIDIVYTRYGKDKLNGVDVFASGDKIRAAAQFRTSFDQNDLLVLATFRSKAKAEAGFGGALSPLQQRLTPNQGELLVAYAVRFSPRFTTQFQIEGRFFEKTPAFFSGYTLVGIGAVPEVALSDDVGVPLRLRYFYGTAESGRTLNGLEAGLGLVMRY